MFNPNPLDRSTRILSEEIPDLSQRRFVVGEVVRVTQQDSSVVKVPCELAFTGDPETVLVKYTDGSSRKVPNTPENKEHYEKMIYWYRSTLG